MKTGLVLEGGGMRGIYTNGVLDCLMDNGFYSDYVIGVSAGACGGVSYVSGQRGRSKRINLGYLDDKRYLGLESLRKTGSMFGMDFLFEEIPNRLDPFDYAAFLASPIAFVAGVTDVETGKPAYFGKEAMNGTNVVLRASSAIPVFSPAVEINGRRYLDGGTSDPIPVKKALEDGCDRLVVVLTRDRSYQKQPEKLRVAYRRVFRDAPKMIEALDRRHEIYNETLDFLRGLERRGIAQVIAPGRPVQVGRFERDHLRLNALYKTGMLDAQKFLSRIGWERPTASPVPQAAGEN